MPDGAPPRWRDRLARLRPYPSEILTYGAAAATLLFLRAGGLAYGWNTVEHTFGALLRTLPAMLVAGVALHALAVRLDGGSPREYLRALKTRHWWVTWLRLMGTFVGFIYAYTWLKVSIPLLRTDVHDAQLWALDRWLHFGVSPTVFSIELVAGTPLAGFVDVFYAAWLIAVPGWTAYLFASRRDDRRRNFAFGSALLWIAGAWIYYALPAIGPCFWSPDVLEPIRDQIRLAAGTQWMLWQQYTGLLASRGGGLQVFSPALGVAALPSLHVGAYVFFALWSKRYAKRWTAVWTVATVLIFFGSLATGWHYAVDGYAGALLGWAVMRITDRCEPVAAEPPDRGTGGQEGE